MMFEKILVLTDFSAYARKSLEYIRDFPDVKDVVLLNVVAKDPQAKAWDPIAEIKNAKKKLAKEKKLLESSGVNVTVRAVSAREGEIDTEIPAAIQSVASDENVQLVVMGARGKSLVQSILLGSLTRNLLRFGDKHLLIMRYKMPGNSGTKDRSLKIAEPPDGPEMLEKFGTKIFSKVLIPTDFSQPADAVISSIGSLKGIKEIVLLHVISKGESKEEIEAAVKDATMKLNHISQELSQGSVKVTPRVAVGSPTEAIRSVAEDENVSLIAISSVGRDALRSGRIGSITYDVANTANRPVLVFRLKLVYNFAF
ncbi:MAG: universal stress protein [Methanothrix sp.]|nr:universal stress protein [Methanothrix sp.]